MKKSIAKVMHERKMIKSLSEARRLVHMKVITVNGEKVTSIDQQIEEEDKIEFVKKKK